VIFATNLAANFDPAFERRIRTHILFAMPGAEERAQIWKVQLHARKTPLAGDVDFEELGTKYEVSGGDIKNAVLKAAQMATAEPGADAQKQIHQRHFIAGMEDVLAAKKVMEQSLFDGDGSHSSAALAGMAGEWGRLARNQEAVENEVSTLLERVAENERHIAALPGIIERFDDAGRAAQATLRAEDNERLDHLTQQHESTRQALEGLKSQFKAADEEHAVLRRELGEIATQIVAHRQEREVAFAEQSEVLARWKTQWMIALALGVLAIVIALIAAFLG
jgi:hypothetical protein